MTKPTFVALVASALGTGCISHAQQAFEKTAHRDLHSIALLDVPPPEKFDVTNLGGLGSAFGLIGAATEILEAERKTDDFTAALAAERADFGRGMLRLLVRDLQKDGYSVSVLGYSRPHTADESDEDADYSSIHTDADAILEVYFMRAGYVALGTQYEPWLMVCARLVDGKSKARFFAQEYAYGNALDPPEGVVHIKSSPRYSYGDAPELNANAAEALGALRIGTEVIAQRIATALR